MKNILFLILTLVSGLNALAQGNERITLYHSPEMISSDTNNGVMHPWRIPALAKAKNGDLIAIAEYRSGNGDIGSGEIDVYFRVSKDNGKTWSERRMGINGKGGTGRNAAYGDVAVVADRGSNRVLVMCISGIVHCINQDTRERMGIARAYINLNPRTGEWEWEEAEDVSDQMMDLTLGNQMSGAYFASGKICQSRLCKKGSSYRLYSSVLGPHPTRKEPAIFAIYSDDFGQTWHQLGTEPACTSHKCDEPKCEELPNGDVVLSSRTQGRYFNIYKFDNIARATGKWQEAVNSNTCPDGIMVSKSFCNGEILLVNAINNETKRKTTLALQSLPFGWHSYPKTGGGRCDVGIYYKELASQAEDYDSPLLFASNWDGSYIVAPENSAYSTMVLQDDKRIGFLWENDYQKYDGLNFTGGDICYASLSLETITAGKYSLYTKKKKLIR